MAIISSEKYLENLKKAINGIPKETERIVISKMDDVIDLVREKQIFEKGIDSTGKTLGIYRGFRQKTKIWQDSRGFPKNRGNKYNLLDSGTFFNSMVLRKFRGKYQFIIKSNVPYLNDILKTTNTTEQKLLGMTNENVVNLDKQIIKPELDKWLLRTI